MPIPSLFQGKLRLPLIGSPMFIVSYPELVAAQCKAGMVGTFPSLNARPVELLDEWLGNLTHDLGDYAAANPDRKVAPFGVNLIVHRSNTRLQEDLALVVKHKVPLVITSVGAPTEIVEHVHGYGGIVFHDVTNVRHAKKAMEAGVDGLILVCAGAGGHAGTLSPFALLPEVRSFFDGTIVLAGAMSSGQAVRAAEVMGADMAYMGTRFIATAEAHANPAYKQMILDGQAADIVYTPFFSGIPGNYLGPSIAASGLDVAELTTPGRTPDVSNWDNKPKAWKDVWSAGQGIGSIGDVPTVAELVDRMAAEYSAACALPSAFAGSGPAAE
ncbi:NAD(P)H-dependent flavin oxidoreductase [Indioceanicola profundi]|uniref:NAD(P)H-dependent flavin oxidoreductase n=1 Tax=Indioceanicola profundi TaxID=2220096 RepID=UPI000E6AA711|nr:nitronate monooxygenase family protein [Indioceanicola profundi]